jgi:hypothetical protein
MNIYTFDVYLTSGPMSEKFVKENQIVLRKIEIRGDQTLEDLHFAIFDAFDREEEHMYEYQIGGKGPNDPKAICYDTTNSKSTKNTRTTTIDSLGLKTEDVFGYCFDFGDDWWHQINLMSIQKEQSIEGFPKVIERIGKSPPQN